MEVPLTSGPRRLSARGVSFAFGQETIVREVDFSVDAGERVALVGPSGSGKSTLLHLLAGVLVPAEGLISFGDETLSQLDVDGRADIRLRHFGFVFQFAELLPELTLRENAELPSRIIGLKRSVFRQSVAEVFDSLGITDVADKAPSQVSGGQRQRAAIARALAHQPSVVFADEPTGALDQETGSTALQALLSLSESLGTSLVVVTHDLRIASQFDRVVTLRDGCVDA